MGTALRHGGVNLNQFKSIATSQTCVNTMEKDKLVFKADQWKKRNASLTNYFPDQAQFIKSARAKKKIQS